MWFCDPMDCSPPGFSVCWIFLARILECIAISFSRGSSPPRDWTQVSCTGRRILYHLTHLGSFFITFTRAKFTRLFVAPSSLELVAMQNLRPSPKQTSQLESVVEQDPQVFQTHIRFWEALLLTTVGCSGCHNYYVLFLQHLNEINLFGKGISKMRYL